jgi:DNA-binding HxlR family transcriptional regulator
LIKNALLGNRGGMDASVQVAAPAEAQERCPLTGALEAIGGKWSLIILYYLAEKTRRFAELQRLMPSISHKVLTETLRGLEQHDLVLRTAFDQVPPRVEYSISEHGRTVLPLIEAVRIWGRVHLTR